MPVSLVSCAYCGLTPANVNGPTRRSVLLEPDPLASSRCRCRNREACARRRRALRLAAA